jgi:hypothetical protein
LPVEVLNPAGEPIILPAWCVKRLDSLKLLFWNRGSKFYQISPVVFRLMPLWQNGPDFILQRLRGVSPESSGARSKDSGYANAFLRALGEDCSGLNVSIERTRMLEQDLDRTLDPVTARARSQLLAEEAVREVRRAK